MSLLCVNISDITRVIKTFSHFFTFTFYLLYCYLRACKAIRTHVFGVYPYHAFTINHSVNICKQVAGGLSTAKSHCPIAEDERTCTFSIPTYTRGFRKLDTAMLRQGGLSTVDPLRSPSVHRSLFMLLFIMVPSNPCLVHYYRAAMCQHLAGGLQGSKQQIGCTEPTM